MSRKLVKQLKNIKNENGRLNPDRSWVAQTRVKLIEDIKCNITNTEVNEEMVKTSVFDTISEGLHVFVSGRVLSMARSSLTILLVGAVAVSGWIASVSASYDSLPGEALYGVKMAAESTELLVASVIGSDEDEVTTILKHASSRVDEYQRSESTEQATVAIKSLKEKIESTQDSMDKVNGKSPEKVVAVAKVVEKKTSEILDSLTEPKEKERTIELKDIAPEVTKVQLKKDVVEVEALIQNAGIKAVGVLVENVNKEDVKESVITKKEVTDTINRRLDKLTEGVLKLDVTVVETSEKASSTIAIIKTTTTTKNIIGIEGAVGETASSTEMNSKQSTTSSTQDIVIKAVETEKKVIDAEQKVVVAEQKIGEANKIAETTKADVKILIEQDNFTAALQKIIELDTIKTETKVVVDEASIAVNIVEKVVVQDAKDLVVQEAIDASKINNIETVKVSSTEAVKIVE